MFKSLLNKNEMYLHKERVEIAKLTPAKWKKLFGTVDRLPGLIIQVITAPQKDLYAYVITALELATDEIVDVVSALTDLDRDYIENYVGIDEILEYLQRIVKLNRLDTTVKNAKSLLLKSPE